MRFLGLLLASSALMSSGVHARQLCYLADPTGTPLNVRTRPNGAIVGALNNGTKVVEIERTYVESRGELWSLIATIDPGKDGWVFRKYLDCER